MKKELVISVFDKDLSWLDKVSKEVLIKKYRKGSNLNLDGEIYLSNNVGRDVHTFFYHILNNYDNLADITFFSQDYPFDHIENYVEIINSDVDFITKFSIKLVVKFADTPSFISIRYMEFNKLTMDEYSSTCIFLRAVFSSSVYYRTQ
jgi:hypothetical protein